MERLGDLAIEIINELHRTRLNYETEYIPLINGAFRLADYEDTGLIPSDIKDMRNDLCFLCGKYKEAHNGACDECRWRKV